MANLFPYRQRRQRLNVYYDLDPEFAYCLVEYLTPDGCLVVHTQYCQTEQRALEQAHAALARGTACNVWLPYREGA